MSKLEEKSGRLRKQKVEKLQTNFVGSLGETTATRDTIDIHDSNANNNTELNDEDSEAEGNNQPKSKKRKITCRSSTV